MTSLTKQFFPLALLLCLAQLALASSASRQAASQVIIPRAEYPRPQFERSEWQCLNGEWSYLFDFGQSGMERGLEKSRGFDDRIVVPFCVESPLSGVGRKDFTNALWYHRTINVPEAWRDKHVMLHFGGVDYHSQIFINGRRVFEHYGGAASFSVDIARYVRFGADNDLVVYVEDDVRSQLQPGGKQSRQLNSYACFYTRVTGIWSTVWLEPIAKGGLKKVRVTPDLDNSQFVLEPEFFETDGSHALSVIIKDGNKTVWRGETRASGSASLTAHINNVKTWSPEHPFLYDVEYAVKDRNGKVVDQVKSYVGMRKAELRGRTFYLNNEPYYQRLVLDQGYYPDGQWTAPTDEHLRRDIELAKEAGFNGARLHQKVFEQRYFYWADRLGYIVWGESPSWEMDWTNPVAGRNMITEWEECIDRDYNEPCIVAWSPLNETWIPDRDRQRARLTNDLYFITHRLDRTRPVVTTSGGYHAGFTDIYAEHTYEQDPVRLYEQLREKEDGSVYVQHPHESAPYKGEAYMIDEFGGIRWVQKMNAQEVAPEGQFWGYGKDPESLEEFYRRLEDQVNVILSIDHICGFCYTQIVDVELEKNGIYTYDRQRKFDMERIRKIFSKDRQQAKQEVERMLKANDAQSYANPVVDLSLPDPTVVKAPDGHFYLYATENTRNLPIYRSDNLVDWTFLGTAFTNKTRPNFVKKGGIWAPDINYIDGRYVMYYAMSTWGGEWACGIGVATADRPEGPFTDHGKLFISKEIDIQNCIDPFYIEDGGRKYLFWGSFHGIYGAELTDDGLKLKEGTKPERVAGDFMEAAYIHKRDGHYYLFGSEGRCCEGAKSTYRVTVGRSDNLFGPYVDKQGQKLLDNHFEVILHSNDKFVGPGHNSEIITDKNGTDWMLYHSYLRSKPENGRLLLLDEVKWHDGWPHIVGDVPSAKSKAPVF